MALGVFASFDCSWVPSVYWFRCFVVRRLGLSWRKGTRDARKLPPNLPDITKTFLCRFFWLVVTYKLAEELVVNFDETGLLLLPAAQQTWGVKGEANVQIVGGEEKRQFTVSPIISAAGELVGRVQVIWGGKTRACEPNDSIQVKHNKGMYHTHSESHWSTAKTIMEAVDDLYESYIKPRMLSRGPDPAKTHLMILWDCHSSHRDKMVITPSDAQNTSIQTLIIMDSHNTGDRGTEEKVSDSAYLVRAR